MVLPSNHTIFGFNNVTKIVKGCRTSGNDDENDDSFFDSVVAEKSQSWQISNHTSPPNKGATKFPHMFVDDSFVVIHTIYTQI